MEELKFINLIAELNLIGKAVTDEYKRKLNEGDVWATGKLFNSVDYKIIKTEKGYNLAFLAEKYYINIEEGRAAGKKMPPLNEIKTWIIEKGLPRTKGLDYIIARSIAKNGIRPRPYLRDIESELDKYTKSIEKALTVDIQLAINEILNTIKLS